MTATTMVVLPPVFVLVEMVLIVGVPSILWIISGRWRLRHFARYFHEEGYNSQRYLERLKSIRRERAFFARGITSFLAVPMICAMVACIISSTWSMALLPAISSSFLALVDMYACWLGRDSQNLKSKMNPEMRMIRLLLVARVVHTAPFGISLIMLLIGFSISIDAIVVAAILGVLASPLPVILAPVALPIANAMPFAVGGSTKEEIQR